MPSSHQQPARLTKKQKKATAFRERGSSDKSKDKGKGKGTISKPKPNPTATITTSTPGHSRPLTTTGDNGEDYYDSEDANAIPAMEDQDQDLTAMAGYTEGDVRVPMKKTKMEFTSTSTAAQSKRKRGGGGRAGELEGSEAQPRPKKKARLARSSAEILPPAREEDGATSMSDGGDGSKTKGKGSQQLRYILFIGNVLPLTLI